MSGPVDSRPPEIAAVLETSLYHSRAESAQIEAFYADLLGLRAISRWPGGIAFRVGAGVLLLFDREHLASRRDPISAHGSDGPGHACLVVAGAGDYEAWRGRVSAAGIEITHDHEWHDHRRSFYFTDPAANLIEIADGDLWPR